MKNQKMSNKPIDTAELEKCKNDEYYFFKKYIIINGDYPLMTREQFHEMVIAWNKPHPFKPRRPYSSWDGPINDCGDANEY